MTLGFWDSSVWHQHPSSRTWYSADSCFFMRCDVIHHDIIHNMWIIADNFGDLGFQGLAPAPFIMDLVQRRLVVLQAMRLVDHDIIHNMWIIAYNFGDLGFQGLAPAPFITDLVQRGLVVLHALRRQPP